MEGILRYAKDIKEGNLVIMGQSPPMKVERIHPFEDENGKIELRLVDIFKDRIYTLQVLPNDLIQIQFGSAVTQFTDSQEAIALAKAYQENYKHYQEQLVAYEKLSPIKKIFTKKPKYR